MEPTTEFRQLTSVLGLAPQQQQVQAAAVEKALAHGLQAVDVLALVAKYQAGAFAFLFDVFGLIEARQAAPGPGG